MNNTGKRPRTAIVLAAAALAAVIGLLAGGCKNPISSGKIAVTGVTLDKAAITLAVGATETLTATVQPKKAKNQTVIWTSGNEASATVDQNGLVTARAEGTAVITVTTEEGGFSKQCTVTVTATGGSGGPDDTVLTDVSVTIAGPAKGEAPATTAATDDTGYTCGAVSWSPDDNPFLGGKVYTATVTLTADEHYTFAEEITAAINAQTATVTNNTGAALTLSHTFAATNTKTVTGISIKTQPAKLAYAHGDKLDLSELVVTLAHDDNTSEDVALADFASKNISENPAHEATLSHTAHDGKPVAVKFGELTANTNNLTVAKAGPSVTWPTAATITYGAALSTSALTGGAGEGSFAWTDGTVIPTVANSGYEVTFTPTDANYNILTHNVSITVNPASITAAAITVTAPAVGRRPNTTVSGTGNFTGQVSWTPDDQTFMVGKAYTAAVTLTANVNYAFAANQNLSATINGQNAAVTNNNNSTVTLSYAFAEILDPNIGMDGLTEATAFKVYDVETLNRVGKGTGNWVGNWSLSAYYVQIADITLPPVDAGESNWIAIGGSSNLFTGTYNGGGCTITNLTIINVSSSIQGMFGYIGTGGVVKNVGLVDGSVSVNYYVGGVVFHNEGTVQNCYTTGNVSSVQSETGGVVGWNYGTVQNCYSTSTVSCGPGSTVNIGGVVARNYGTTQNCVALNPRVTHSYNTASIGRVMGSSASTTGTTNNYARSDLIPKYNWNGSTGTDKTVVSDLNGVDGESITAAQYNSESWWKNAGNWKTDDGAFEWDFVNVWEWNPVTNLPILRGFSGEQNHTVPPIP